MDYLDSIRTFAAVAKAGSFAEAARKLRLSPSVVTRAIAQLEDQLGITVLSRTTRSVRVTERGRIYLERCEQILEDVNSAERLARGEDAELRGELTIAAPVMFGRLHVLPIVSALLGAHQALSIRLVLSDRNAHLVDDGVDVAVRIGELADSAAIAVKLAAVTRVVVASPSYVAARGTYFDLAEFAPGPMYTDVEDMAKGLQDLDGLVRGHADAYAAFVEKFAPWDDGGAAARVVDAFFEPQ